MCEEASGSRDGGGGGSFSILPLLVVLGVVAGVLKLKSMQSERDEARDVAYRWGSYAERDRSKFDESMRAERALPRSQRRPLFSDKWRLQWKRVAPDYAWSRHEEFEDWFWGYTGGRSARLTFYGNDAMLRSCIERWGAKRRAPSDSESSETDRVEGPDLPSSTAGQGAAMHAQEPFISNGQFRRLFPAKSDVMECDLRYVWVMPAERFRRIIEDCRKGDATLRRGMIVSVDNNVRGIVRLDDGQVYEVPGDGVVGIKGVKVGDTLEFVRRKGASLDPSQMEVIRVLRQVPYPFDKEPQILSRRVEIGDRPAGKYDSDEEKKANLLTLWKHANYSDIAKGVDEGRSVFLTGRVVERSKDYVGVIGISQGDLSWTLKEYLKFAWMRRGDFVEFVCPAKSLPYNLNRESLVIVRILAWNY